MDDLRRWFVGVPSDDIDSRDGVVALSSGERAAAAGRARHSVGFHQAATETVAKASDAVIVTLPHYRGKSFVPVLAWLVAARLAGPDTRVSWRIDKQQGPDPIQRLLHSLGWRLDQTRHGRLRELNGQPPPAVDLPEPAHFTTRIGRASVAFDADYGAFSPTEVDAGTQLLLDIALRGEPTDVLADVGTGYGPLAIGLVRNGVAGRAVATDVDSVALWLATRNAAANDVKLDVVWSPDPRDAEPTSLTVCNVPTHINTDDTAALMRGLTDRARGGRLLVVVHATLEERYSRHIRAAGLSPTAHRGETHVVLESCG